MKKTRIPETLAIDLILLPIDLVDLAQHFYIQENGSPFPFIEYNYCVPDQSWRTGEVRQALSSASDRTLEKMTRDQTIAILHAKIW